MQKGLVLKSTGKWYEVKGEDGTVYQCQVRGKIRLEGRSTTNVIQRLQQSGATAAGGEGKGDS